MVPHRPSSLVRRSRLMLAAAALAAALIAVSASPVGAAHRQASAFA